MREGWGTRLLTGMILAFWVSLPAFSPATALAQVDVAITADNAYTLGYGTASSLSNIVANVQNCVSAGEIFNCPGKYVGPELYTNVPIGPADYIYIIAYDDESRTQGVLAQFSFGYSGASYWEVFATGIDVDCGTGGPSLATINAEIVKANSLTGGPGSSVGWVSTTPGVGTVGVLAVGEDNSSAAGTFVQACTARIGTQAHWMWYNPDPQTIGDPFQGSELGEFLIFRVRPTPAACSDGIDNDLDGCGDYPGDSGCTGLDDDSEAGGVCSECADGYDNDGDGCADYPADLGCSDQGDNSEAGAYCLPLVRGCPAAPRIREVNLCEAGPSCFSLSAMVDTIRYGGTVWAEGSARWEAVRGSSWTFDTGTGSSLNIGLNPNKPIGYHQSMEGWIGQDQTVNPLPYFRLSTECAISGSYSFWAGVNAVEANALCYGGGAGYGNNWSLLIRKFFAYSGAGSVNFQFDYRVEAEPPYDRLCVAVDTSGAGVADPVVVAEFTGVSAGTFARQLLPGDGMRFEAGPVAILFIASSDGAYSDEDGLYPTACGLAVVDNVQLSGGITDFSNFESSANGWSQVIPTVGIGDYSDLLSLSDLPPPASFCPCGVSDSVLVFFDQNWGGHPLGQDNLALSPWIDLLAGGDVGKPGHLVFYDVYAELPLANYVFPQIVVRSYPSLCPVTGLVTISPFRESCSGTYYGEAPFCSAPDHPQAVDVSCLVGPMAEEVQIGVGVVNLCGIAEFGPICSGLTNSTPWFDNISFGVYGSPNCPLVRTIPCERFQDNFAADGTLNPAAPGRIDVNHLKNRLLLASGAILGDTLVACGDGGNTEVRLVFRVTPGPFVNGAALATTAARWTPEPGLTAQYGGNWYSARMDTAQQGRQLRYGWWMTAYHEADPGYMATDTSPDPNDQDRASINDMVPDHIFTPGSRIDYFVTSRYLPPDPRNPTGLYWCTDPDTTSGTFYEVEVLPSSMAADSSWNCTLYVSHHGECDSYQKYLEESGLTGSLGLGGNNFEGTRYDRYDRQGASPTQISFGRPLASRVGCSLTQAFAYRNIAWHSGDQSSRALTNEDAYILDPWLRLQALGGNRFWGSGSDLASSMHLEPATRNFLNNTLGVVRTCRTIRDNTCPPPDSGTDPTTCMPTAGVGGAHFSSSVSPFAGGSNCSSAGSFDLLAVNPLVGSAMGQLSYMKLGTPYNYMSVTNWNTLDADYKTVLDGAPVGRLRSDSFCIDPGASLARTDDVLTWFGSDLICSLRPGLVDAPEPATPPAPEHRLTLGNAYPNPMAPRTRIPFLVGRGSAPVTLQIYDVTGRLVRTLASGPLAVGPHEVDWDGRTEDGALAPAGLYFYRLSSAEIVLARKLILMR